MAKKPKKNLKKRHIPMWMIDKKATLDLLALTIKNRPELTPQQAINEWKKLDFVSHAYPEDRMEYLRELKRYYEVEATQQEYEEMIKQLERSGLL